MDEWQAGALDEIFALINDIAPGDVARELARLDERLIDRLCRPGSDTPPANGVASGMAYWLLRDALTRRAAEAA